MYHRPMVHHDLRDEIVRALDPTMRRLNTFALRIGADKWKPLPRWMVWGPWVAIPLLYLLALGIHAL